MNALSLRRRRHPFRSTVAAVLVSLVGLGGPVVPAVPATAATAPAVTGVAPLTGSTNGGTRVTVTGRGFSHVRAVRFGAVIGTSVRVLSSTRLRVTAPRHAAGRVDVRVVTAAGRSALVAKDHFTFVAPPRVSAVSPVSGHTSGGTRVTVTGTGFRRVTAVRFGSSLGGAVSVLSTTKLLVTAPAHAAGAVHVRVTGAYGTSPALAADVFMYVAPPATAPSGSYSGTDNQGHQLTFFVSATGTALQDISVPTVGLSCVPDGAAAVDQLQIASVTLNPDGSFSSTTNQSGVFAGHPATFTYVFNGHLNGVTADGAQKLAGVLRESISYTDTPARDCTSNDQAWSATRDTQPAQPTTAPPSGSYSGTDNQGHQLTFFVSATGTALQDISVPTVGLSCVPDGAAAVDQLQIASVTLNPNGSFTSTTNQSGVFAGHPATFTYIFRGNVHGLSPNGVPRLAGQLRESISYTDTPARDCTSNDQAWNATRDTQPAQPTTAPPSGSYSGTDNQGHQLTFFVSATGTALQDISVPTVGLSCVPDGAAAVDQLQIASVTLNPNGSFTSTTNQSGVFAGHPATFTYIFRGNVHGLSPNGVPRLAGQLRESISYTDTPARDCTSNDQAWNALKS
jgi:hypothetical protein